MAPHGKSMEASHCRRPRFHSSKPTLPPFRPPPLPTPSPPDRHPLCSPPALPPHFRASRKRLHRGRRVFGHLSIILRRSGAARSYASPKKCEKSFILFYPFFRTREKKNQFPRRGRIAEARRIGGPPLLGYFPGASPALRGTGGIKNTAVFLARRVPAPLITSGGRIAPQIMRWAKVNEKVSRSRPDMIFPIKPSHFNIQHL